MTKITRFDIAVSEIGKRNQEMSDALKRNVPVLTEAFKKTTISIDEAARQAAEFSSTLNKLKSPK